MKHKNLGFIVAALGILGFATLMLVIIPSFQLAEIEPEEGLKPYSDLELAGRKIYIQEGCVYCHSQQPRDPRQAPDMARGWGRPSTPGDYAYDYPHLLGTMRTGPDLFNVGVRQPSEEWHLVHLYQPRAVVSWSIMPAYPFLFEHKPVAAAGDRVITLPPPYAPASGVVVAKPEAMALVAYLKALKRDYPSNQLPFRSPRKKAEEATP
jgi:cytochrome c oxidase cbb3-type subunit II